MSHSPQPWDDFFEGVQEYLDAWAAEDDEEDESSDDEEEEETQDMHLIYPMQNQSFSPTFPPWEMLVDADDLFCRGLDEELDMEEEEDPIHFC
jgi:hypothetical protein